MIVLPLERDLHFPPSLTYDNAPPFSLEKKDHMFLLATLYSGQHIWGPPQIHQPLPLLLKNDNSLNGAYMDYSDGLTVLAPHHHSLYSISAQ